MGKKITRRKIGRERQYVSLLAHIEYDDPPATREEAERGNEDELFAALDAHEKRAKETLQAANLPTSFYGTHVRADGSECTLYALVADRKLTPEWWAVQTLDAVMHLRRYLAMNDTIQAARWAMLLQRAIDSVYVDRIDFDAAHGSRRRKPTHSDAEKRQWERIANDLRRDNPKIGLRELAREIEKQTGKPADTIRPHITAYLNSK